MTLVHDIPNLPITNLRDVERLFTEGVVEKRSSFSPRTLLTQKTGGIISISHMAGGFPEIILPAHVQRHDTEVFFFAQDTQSKDLFLTEGGEHLLSRKVQQFHDTLNFSDEFFAAHPDQDLIVHCINGRHRSPVLGLGIIAHVMGEGREMDACWAAYKLAFSTSPAIRAGELAFIDCALGRNGKLVSAWAKTEAQIGFSGHYPYESAEEKRRLFMGVLAKQKTEPSYVTHRTRKPPQGTPPQPK